MQNKKSANNYFTPVRHSVNKQNYLLFYYTRTNNNFQKVINGKFI